MGKINSVGYENRTRRKNKFEIYAILEIRLNRVDSEKEAEKAIKKLQDTMLDEEVVIFVP